jgi:hypothetical protein
MLLLAAGWSIMADAPRPNIPLITPRDKIADQMFEQYMQHHRIKPGVPPGLNSRDQRLSRQLQLTPNELAMDFLQSTSPGSLRELLSAIQQEKRPAVKALLQQELNKIAPYLVAPRGIE